METTEAELHGWNAAPYRSKAEVDASYARLIDAALRPEHADAVRVGIASHNLFHLSWALEVARSRGVESQVDVEMLEGMANSESLAIARTGQRVLLYAPVTRHDDFASAVAYLVRRLDENTSDENYLKAAFDIGTDAERFAEQSERFTASVRERHAISTSSLRHAPRPASTSLGFANVANFDPTSTKAFDEITGAFARVRATPELQIPLVIDDQRSSPASSKSATIPARRRRRGIATRSPTPPRSTRPSSARRTPASRGPGSRSRSADGSSSPARSSWKTSES